MLGLLIILIVSWMLLHFFEQQNLGVLGFSPILKGLKQFALGIICMVGILLIILTSETFAYSLQWELSPTGSLSTFSKAVYYHIRSALTEDLVFRGALLYLLIQKIGWQKACLISALVFGVYHVFSYGMLEARWIAILYVTIVTGITGYVWAFTYAKTKSIFLGLGFHLAYNLFMCSFFPSQPYGELIFTVVSKSDLS